MLLVGAALCIALVAILSGSAHAGIVLEERKLPMKFSWVDCQLRIYVCSCFCREKRVTCPPIFGRIRSGSMTAPITPRPRSTAKMI